ncbi:MAG TPA: hypothetical protein VMM85_05090 [Methylomirabilota bacterium]|nr:hypothetical protein [Methylomirabilota bacterium]
MDRNLPSTQREADASGETPGTPLERRQPMSVAFLPLALVTFIILAFVIAAWTVLAAPA